jgi:hypothetical protein
MKFVLLRVKPVSVYRPFLQSVTRDVDMKLVLVYSVRTRGRLMGDNDSDETETCIKLQINIISSTLYRNFGLLQ